MRRSHAADVQVSGPMQGRVEAGALALARGKARRIVFSIERGGQMDREGLGKSSNRWSWLPAQMPGVARLLREKRSLYGDAHVNECWKRGVIDREPGWFFAMEGALAVGTPDDDQRLAWFAGLTKLSQTSALLDLRRPEGGHGAH